MQRTKDNVNFRFTWSSNQMAIWEYYGIFRSGLLALSSQSFTFAFDDAITPSSWVARWELYIRRELKQLRRWPQWRLQKNKRFNEKKQQLCTCSTIFSTFLWRPLYDFDMKPPNATFYGGPHPQRPRGSQSGHEKRCDESFQVRAKEPLGTDSHQAISKNLSGCRLLIGHKKCFVLLCPIGKQFLLSSFHQFVHNGYCLDHGLSGSCTTEVHAVRKLSVWYKIPIWFQNTVCLKTKDAFPKIQAWAYNRYSHLHLSRLA